MSHERYIKEMLKMNYLNDILVQLYDFLKVSGAWAHTKSRA